MADDADPLVDFSTSWNTINLADDDRAYTLRHRVLPFEAGEEQRARRRRYYGCDTSGHNNGLIIRVEVTTSRAGPTPEVLGWAFALDCPIPKEEHLTLSRAFQTGIMNCRDVLPPPYMLKALDALPGGTDNIRNANIIQLQTLHYPPLSHGQVFRLSFPDCLKGLQHLGIRIQAYRVAAITLEHRDEQGLVLEVFKSQFQLTLLRYLGNIKTLSLKIECASNADPWYISRLELLIRNFKRDVDMTAVLGNRSIDVRAFVELFEA